MPLDTIKTQMQIRSYKSIPHCATTILTNDGVRGLYFGIKPFVLQACGKAAVRFAFFDMLTKAIDVAGVDRAQRPAFWSLACGLGAGSAEALLWTAPTERIKVLRQARAGSGLGAPPAIVTIVREQGLSGLYVGSGATAMRQASSVAARFAVLDHVKTTTCRTMGFEKGKAPWWVTFLGGGLGGFVSAVLNNPIDVVKSRIQAGKGDVGIVQCMRQVAAEGGLLAFYRGITARGARLFLSQAIQFTIVGKLTGS